MSDPSPAADPDERTAKTSPKSLLDRLLRLVRREPEDREGIKAVLDAAHERQLIDEDAYSMIRGALAFSEQTVWDIMVPRSRMDMLDISQPLPELLAVMLDTAHSRFPVYEGSRENIIGLLLAKDLLRCILEPNLDIRSLLRPAVFIPEAKRLNVLLRDFRINRNHLAIVIDEHGGVSGMITMEDVLEQIVGAIEDEFDAEEQTIFPDSNTSWRVMGITPIVAFNETLGSDLPHDEYDTVGGWMADELDRIPRRGDVATRGDLRIEVLRADARRALWLRVRRLGRPAAPAGDANHAS